MNTAMTDSHDRENANTFSFEKMFIVRRDMKEKKTDLLMAG